MTDIIVKDSSGNKVAQFKASSDESLATQIQEEGVPLVVACGVGACGTCKTKVNKGMEHLDPEANGPVQYPIEENEILSCICGTKSSTPQDAEVELEIESI